MDCAYQCNKIATGDLADCLYEHVCQDKDVNKGVNNLSSLIMKTLTVMVMGI